jgi:hypothetical protein
MRLWSVGSHDSTVLELPQGAALPLAEIARTAPKKTLAYLIAVGCNNYPLSKSNSRTSP